MSEDGDRARPGRLLAAGSVAVLCGLVVWFLVLGPAFGDGGGTLPESLSRTNVTESEPTVPSVPPRSDPEPETELDDPENDSGVGVESEIAESDDADAGPGAEVTTSTTIDLVSAAEDPPPATTVIATTVPPTTEVPESTVAPDVTVAPATSSNEPSYPTQEDGSPVPVVAIFDGETIALSGVVPSKAASERLEVLAIANSAVPNASVADFTTINPDVPITVGVRVIEMQSPRFPESSAEILPDHAVQLDRAVSVMKALPHISVTVVGHADQRGDPQRNYEISADRAQSVVDYMASRGIEPARMAARAVGESDLLTLNDDDVAFALNRRTEFVFYGLLVD